MRGTPGLVVCLHISVFVWIKACVSFSFHHVCEPCCRSPSVYPPWRGSWAKQMALWDRFQSATSYRPSAVLSSCWHRLGLNQGLDGCHFTPAHSHSARKHWGWWSYCWEQKARNASSFSFSSPLLFCPARLAWRRETSKSLWEEYQSGETTARWFQKLIFLFLFPYWFTCRLNNHSWILFYPCSIYFKGRLHFYVNVHFCSM